MVVWSLPPVISRLLVQSRSGRWIEKPREPSGISGNARQAGFATFAYSRHPGRAGEGAGPRPDKARDVTPAQVGGINSVSIAQSPALVNQARSGIRSSGPEQPAQTNVSWYKGRKKKKCLYEIRVVNSHRTTQLLFHWIYYWFLWCLGLISTSIWYIFFFNQGLLFLQRSFLYHYHFYFFIPDSCGLHSTVLFHLDL